MQDMHAHEVDSKRLSARMGELQRAHVLQNRVIQELEEGLGRMPLMKSTVRKQEMVIAGLEDLLRKAVQQMKCMRDAEIALRQERQSAEAQLAAVGQQLVETEQRVVLADRSAADYRDRLQTCHEEAQAAQAIDGAGTQPAPQQQQQQQRQTLTETPQPKEAEPAQQRAQGDAGAPKAPLDSAKVGELEQQLKWEQRECEALQRQLEAERADGESLRRQQAEAARASEELRHNLFEMEQQLSELRQRVAIATSDAEAMKSRADASDAAAEAADSDLAQVWPDSLHCNLDSHQGSVVPCPGSYWNVM